MRKLLSCLLITVILFGCNQKPIPDFDSNFEIETYKCDMSHYDGLTSVNHNFVGTTVKELKKTIDEKGYGVFVLSRNTCAHCQVLMQYLNEVAEELNIKVYYIDAESNKYPIVDTDDYDLLYELLYPILEKDDDGIKSLQTPHLFTIIDGEFVDSKVGVKVKGEAPSEKEIEVVKKTCKDFLTPFAR